MWGGWYVFFLSDNRLIWFEYHMNERLTIQIFTNKMIFMRNEEISWFDNFFVVIYVSFFGFLQQKSSSCAIPVFVFVFVTNYLDFFHSVLLFGTVPHLIYNIHSFDLTVSSIYKIKARKKKLIPMWNVNLSHKIALSLNCVCACELIWMMWNQSIVFNLHE